MTNLTQAHQTLRQIQQLTALFGCDTQNVKQSGKLRPGMYFLTSSFNAVAMSPRTSFF